MSILDNQVDLDEAKTRLATTDEADLIRDLAYWSTAELDHHADLEDLARRYNEVLTLHAEAKRWGALTAAEIRTRRDTKRAGASG